MIQINNEFKYIINKGKFLINVIRDSMVYRKDRICPFCNSARTSESANKLFIVKLLRCNRCGLMFRWPKRKAGERAYYEYCYDEFPITRLPPKAELERLKANNFKGSTYDISNKIALIKRYVKGGMILDYGASWGYHLGQFVKEGFLGIGYEIAVNRANFGQENLGIRIIHNPEELYSLGSIFDVIFVNHALEHILEVRSAFDCFYSLLKKGGYLFIFVPDSSNIEKEKWKRKYAFGEKHCIAFDKSFFNKNLISLGFRAIEIKESDLDEFELMVIAEKVDRQ